MSSGLYPELQSVPTTHPQFLPVVTQPYAPTIHRQVIVVEQTNEDVQHGCHCLLWLLTGGLWTPCWIAACCGCCK